MPKTETLYDIIPDKHMNDDLKDFLWGFEEVFEELLEDVENFVDIIDPDRCEEKYLDAMFYEMGFRLWEEINLSVTQKRKLVKSLISLYSQKGTESGVKNAIWFLLGINVQFRWPWRDDCWTLGVSELGNNSELAPETKPHKYHYTVEVHLDQEVSDETEKLLIKIIEFMIEKHLRYKIVQPGEEDALDSWVLGVSRLGWNFETVLKGEE